MRRTDGCNLSRFGGVVYFQLRHHRAQIVHRTLHMNVFLFNLCERLRISFSSIDRFFCHLLEPEKCDKGMEKEREKSEVNRQ